MPSQSQYFRVRNQVAKHREKRVVSRGSGFERQLSCLYAKKWRGTYLNSGIGAVLEIRRSPWLYSQMLDKRWSQVPRHLLGRQNHQAMDLNLGQRLLAAQNAIRYAYLHRTSEMGLGRLVQLWLWLSHHWFDRHASHDLVHWDRRSRENTKRAQKR